MRVLSIGAGVLIVAAVYLVSTQLPDVKRYLKIRSM